MGKKPPDNFSEIGHKAQAEKRLAALQGGIVMHVQSLEHARSNEVLDFCVAQLRAGKTYNELRVMLGLKPANIDKVWRTIRECLVEMILPATEEEALQADAAHSSAMLRKMEEFLEKVEARSVQRQGERNEADFLKLELEAMKQVMEKYAQRTEHYLKMKDIQKKEKRKTGTTIIFKNNFKIARPGEVIDVTNADVGILQATMDDPEDDE